MTQERLDPSRILQTGFDFWSSKVLLTAVEIEVFTLLAQDPRTGPDLGERLGFHPRGTRDFFDALVVLGFLGRDGNGEGALYKNTPETAQFLVKDRPGYIGGMLEMLNARLFAYWDDLPDALKTGQPQNEVKHSKKPIFEELYADLPKLEQFMSAMAGLSRANFEAFADKFDFSGYRTLCDIGGATGLLSRVVAEKHAHMSCTSFDLPAVEPIAKRWIEGAGLTERIATAAGDFLGTPCRKPT